MKCFTNIAQKTCFSVFVIVFGLVGISTAYDSYDPMVETQTVESSPTNYNNTRSNRSTVAAPIDNNICDGATCPDGSCAPTTDQCAMTETIDTTMEEMKEKEAMDKKNIDDDDDALPNAELIPVDSDRTESATEVIYQTRPLQEVDNNQNGDDITVDGLDSDADGIIDDDIENAPSTIPPSTNALEVTAPNAAQTNTGWNPSDCDDDDCSRPPFESQEPSLNKDAYGAYDCEEQIGRCIQVTDLQPEEKKSIRLRIQNKTRLETQDLALAIAYNNSENPNVREVRYNPETKDVEVLHDTQLKLFGLININTPVKTVIDEERSEKTTYPWRAFFATKKKGYDYYRSASNLAAGANDENPLAVDEMERIESTAQQ